MLAAGLPNPNVYCFPVIHLHTPGCASYVDELRATILTSATWGLGCRIVSAADEQVSARRATTWRFEGRGKLRMRVEIVLEDGHERLDEVCSSLRWSLSAVELYSQTVRVHT